MHDELRTMVQPDYIAPLAKAKERRRLEGRVLAFGSGQLVHELNLFDFSNVTELVGYDPFETLDKTPFGGRIPTDTVYHQEWETVLQLDGAFDHVLCLFALHYEPQWLRALCDILNKLKAGGTIHYCEDRGFRAVLDGVADKDFSGIDEVFTDRLSTEVAAPWLPDISASNASAVREVLALFGTTEDAGVFEGRRRVVQANEPQCYLPWNAERTGVSPELVEKVRQQIAGRTEVVERVALFRFTRGEAGPPITLFDLDDARTSLIWRALADRAGRAVGNLIVSRARDQSREGDLAFRKAALAVLYQNVLRHFSFWKSVELVVGALNPEFERAEGAGPRDYRLTCVSPNENPRYWAAHSEPPSFLIEYFERLTDTDGGWAGQEIYKLGEGGVYCWPGTGDVFPDDDLWKVIKPATPLYDSFKTIDPPPCAYIVDPLATMDRLLVSKKNQLLFGALIIYFKSLSDADRANAASELRCLLFVIQTSRSIVVGRAGFLELELLRERFKDSDAIQGPLKVLQDNQLALQEISQAVLQLRSRLDRKYRSPGLPELIEVQELIDTQLFKGSRHDPDKEEPARLMEVALENTFREHLKILLDELGYRGVSIDTLRQLFAPLSSAWLYEHAEYALTFAKTLSRRDEMPLSWFTAGMEGKFQPVHCAAYLQLVGVDVDPLSMLLALDTLRRESEGNYSPQEELSTLEKLGEIDAVSCIWTVRANHHGQSGLEKLKQLFDSGVPEGNTSASLKTIKDATQGMAQAEIVGGTLRLSAKFTIKHHRVRPPRDAQ